ncbi:hypothetical protein [Calycomorphotria hydatis]|uniref:Uncharacterized protein n=1 Tax=Calycomorphotria hydatis TaxID=2528027 RepID=A0A517TAV3_9PLAN|nr:hypothetical protein [Calycomorphotria hydatis]QDT65502.1 hypothetical protein V22_27560 [Calycomorphotria hydatis]
MEVHRQQCQSCKGRDMRDILVREPNEPQRVYVRCINCGAFVARYTLSGYYHHGKGIESYLRTHSVPDDSGREWLDRFRHTEQSALEGFERAVEELQRLEKDDISPHEADS